MYHVSLGRFAILLENLISKGSSCTHKEVIMNWKSCTVLCLALLFMMVSVEGYQEFGIAVKRRDQTNPKIHGNIVVWEDLRNVRWDVFGYDLAESREIQFAPYSNSPAVYGDRVVWLNYEETSCTVCGYHISAEEEFCITAYPSSLKWSPALYENTVVWVQGDRDRDIYGFDIAAGQGIVIAAHVEEQDNPAIYEYIVVWQDKRNLNWDIYGYNLSTDTEFVITTSAGNQVSPAIFGNTVVWADDRNKNYDIYGFNLSTKEEFDITTNPADQKNPAIYGDIIVWADNRNGNYDIYGYSLSESVEFPLITHEGDQKNPSIYGNTVVWEDYRDGNADIYGVILPSTFLDKDGDRYSFPGDCDDNNPEINPAAEEVCDGKDNDCDGLVDEVCRGTLEVFVISSRGKEVERARVFIDDVYTGETDAGGRLIIGDLLMNTYTVRVESEQLEPAEKSIDVEKNVTTITVFEMGTSSLYNTFAVVFVIVLISFAGSMLVVLTATPRLRRRRKQKARPPGLVCPLCQTEIQEDWSVCPHCGADLEGLGPQDKTRIY